MFTQSQEEEEEEEKVRLVLNHRESGEKVQFSQYRHADVLVTAAPQSVCKGYAAASHLIYQTGTEAKTLLKGPVSCSLATLAA